MSTTPFVRHATRSRLSRGHWRTTGHTCTRALGERAVSLLEGWKVLVKSCCRPYRATAVIAAFPAVRHIETRRPPR